MLDPKELRENIEAIAARLATRGCDLNVEKFKELEQARKIVQTRLESLQAKRNTFSKDIGLAKAMNKLEEAHDLLSQVSALGEKMEDEKNKLEEIQSQLQSFYDVIPNLPDETVPLGKNEDDNVEIRHFLKPPVFNFEVRDHVILGAAHLDLESATQLSGSRFVVLKGLLARLHRALAQFMLDTHVTEHGYEEVYVPYLVSSHALYGTGQLPKMADDQFAIQESDLWLIPTAEVPLSNLVRDRIVRIDELPLKFACHSPCFRKEAGSYGKDTRGMFRQHQFDKVEMVQIVHPDQSTHTLEQMVEHAENILKKLELPYRVVALCTGDLGFAAAKTYDVEVWLPSQDRYREISSCSNTRSFQARRLQARFFDKTTQKNQLLHILNGSGVAVGRALIAVMENYQTQAGRIRVPEVLKPYMGGVSLI
jgi:seryl-tRNA synthetase